MSYNNELSFERDLINYLQNNCGNWEKQVIKNPTEEDLIQNWANILFKNNNDIDHLNGKPLTDGEMRQILSQCQNKTPYETNRFINGKTVTIVRDNIEDTLNYGKTISLRIYSRREISGGFSSYQIVEQPRFKTANNVYPNERGDLMLLINGMPVYHIELKRSNVSITQAETQIEKYMHNGAFTGIFSLIQVFIAMNPEEAVYFANPGPEGKFNPLFYFHWTDVNNQYLNNWADFAKSFLSIPRVHEMIGFYTVPDSGDNVLKVLRPYQVYAAEKIWNVVSSSHWEQREHKAGYVWHTTGSGKTLTSFKSAQLIAGMDKADKVVFLIDRVELGEQSYRDYQHFSNIDESINDTSNTDTLIRLLASDDNDEKVIITSIQKMCRVTEDNVSRLTFERIQRKKIVFIIDECHRDQNGTMHQSIENSFPNAMFFGFTGTPDEETTEIFGNELHRYSIADGIRDKNVLGFDSYMVCIYNDNDLREKVALEQVHASDQKSALADPNKIDNYLYFMNQGENECDMVEIESHLPQTQFQTDAYRKKVVEDICSRWQIRSGNSLFHAIFATSSIREAIIYYKLFKDAKNDGKHALNVTAVFNPEDDNCPDALSRIDGITEILSDYNETFGSTYNIGQYDQFKKDLCLRLAHKEQYASIERNKQINIVIVVNQLLTGFDSKWINTVYFDKLLQDKNLIQAASRTNRLFGPEKKHGTLIFYRYPHTMDRNFKQAVDHYSGNRPFGVFVDKLEENINAMNELFKDIDKLFENAGIEHYAHNSEDNGWKMKFSKLFSSFNDRMYSAKLQGFNWRQKEYRFDHNDGTQTMVVTEMSEETYCILLQRYKELFIKRQPSDPEPPYDVAPYIVEIKADSVNNDYMNSNFRQYLLDLNSGDSKAKERTLTELHNTFALLSQKDQDYAQQILIDIENGKSVESNENFTQLLADYKERDKNDRVHEISVGLGLNEEQLREMINLHLNETNINEYNRFNELLETVDIGKAKDYLEKKFNQTYSRIGDVKMDLNRFLRDVIINGI